MIFDNTDRNSTLYDLSKTDTYRLGSKKIFKRSLFERGSNLQNVPKDLRRIYIPDEGKIFVQIDQAGAEALIVAYSAKAGKFRDLFIYGIKPHVYIGLHFPEHWEQEHPYIHEIRLLPINLITQHPKWKVLEKAIKDSDYNPPKTRYYYLYKQTCHSANYGITTNPFILNVLLKSKGNIVLSHREGDKFLNTYRKTFPEIPEWNDKVKNELYRSRCVYNMFGYPRVVTGSLADDQTLKDYIAFGPQSTVGCITHIATTNLQQHIEVNKLEWDILNNGHDSYLIQCPVYEADLCVKQARLFMEQELTGSDGTIFHMKSEATTGYNWAPKSETNPEGLH